MTDRMVQVPVSLIENIRRTYSVLNIGPNVVDALGALLSQPEPTDTTDCTCDWHMTMRDPDPSCPVHSSKDAG